MGLGGGGGDYISPMPVVSSQLIVSKNIPKKERSLKKSREFLRIK